jgi:N-acetylated-alpha-linked acidic dipeptidase
MQTYVKELKTLAQKSREEIMERNRELEEGVFAAMADPRVKSVPPTKDAVPPFLNFAPLDNATESLARASAEYKKALDKAAANGGAAIAKASLIEANQALAEAKHEAFKEEGLGRPWFKHFVDAPGQYTGYEARRCRWYVKQSSRNNEKPTRESWFGRVLKRKLHILSVAQKLNAAVK